MHYTILFIVLALVAPLTKAYQTMRIPNPLRYTFNAYMDKNTTRDNYTLPLTANQFPCKGYLSDMFTDPSGIGRAVTTYQAGRPGWVILTGESLSGSGQVSMSGNNGSLTVIHSFEGNVGTSDQQQLDFMFPVDAPTGPVVLSFTYFPLNSTQVFQSCAAIELLPAEKNATAPTIPFASRPDIFISDMNNSCTRNPAKEVMFPDPGSDFTMNHTVPMADEVDTIIGTCLPVNGFGNGAKDNTTKTIESSPFPTTTSSEFVSQPTPTAMEYHVSISSHHAIPIGDFTRRSNTTSIYNYTHTLTHTHTSSAKPRPTGARNNIIATNTYPTLPISQDGKW
ncbi:hypothetical protein EG329_005875 [Mollisiaceae sp. DMI_Dod_QoI]|nr:hypothetical protein EG329_005875 [Helotiales sp. DMI_Dod_QoI]